MGRAASGPATVESFLREHDISPATRTKLLDILSDPQQLAMLNVELATVVDIGPYFVKAMYNLEGDGTLAVKCYEEILKIRAAISAKYYPNLHAVSRESSSGNPALQQQLIAHGISCLQPGLLYFQEKLGSDTIHPVAAFKAARLFSPTKLIEIQPEAADIDTLNTSHFFLKI